MTLYKHGVGFYERRAELQGEQVSLSFRAEEMNDILKSLTVLDWGGGQVLGVEYPTPQSQAERLAGCSVRLGEDRSLRDLLASLRGRQVRLLLHQGEEVAGSLLGMDEVGERQLLASCLVSLLVEDTGQVQVTDLGRIQGVEILDERGATDLRFFLEVASGQQDDCQVTLRLSPGRHDLSVAYVAPAPTWRVSYRLVVDREEPGCVSLLQGWGHFDNRLEEDLEAVSLSLVAGMPISFVYDLYTPFTPERPVVKEEARVAPGPVAFTKALALGEPMRAMDLADGLALRAPARLSREALEAAAPPPARGEDLGELFQYVIETPVTVGRGHSAMVPIVSARLGCRQDLLYNGAKLPHHPVATLRLQNESGLTLERGPVTVLEEGRYVGEAVLPFTVAGGELAVPYAVELGVKVREQRGASRSLHSLAIHEAFLQVEEWDLRWCEYQVNNSTAKAVSVLVEHPRPTDYEIADTPEPLERSDEHLRFAVQVPPQGEARLRVNERRLVARREELRKQSYRGLQQYLRQGLLDPATHDRIAELLGLWERIEDKDRQLQEIGGARERVYQAQKQIQGNMGVLSASGEEGVLRAEYVEQLRQSEAELQGLAQAEAELRAQRAQLQGEIEARLQSFG
jgi:hypothetical protein